MYAKLGCSLFLAVAYQGLRKWCPFILQGQQIIFCNGSVSEYVKTFQNMTGQIIKMYLEFLEILQNPTNNLFEGKVFSLNILFCQREPLCVGGWSVW